MNRAPIGVFDSGFGGLSAVKELRRLLPGEDVVYFGDNARIPYGDKSPDTIINYSLQDAGFLLSRGVKAILVACGTVSSVALGVLKDRVSVPVVGVIEPAAKRALELTKNGVIGVIGTNATVKSGSYERTLKSLDPKVRAVSVACPLLVPLVENGYVSDDCLITRLALREYLAPLKRAGADCIILGCTHYPLIRSLIADEWGGDELVNTGLEAAKTIASILASSGSLSEGTSGRLSLFSSDSGDTFSQKASFFLEEECPEFERVDILSYGPDR
ncbi:MAG: glutamate racemase [Clostridia bacterium]|nr:glutamate racemase [Clostridia bacterium]